MADTFIQLNKDDGSDDVKVKLIDQGDGTYSIATDLTSTSESVTVSNASGGSAVNIQDGGNSITVDNGGTFAVQSAGAVAHDAADSGNPVKMGGKASSALSAVTLVADADRTDLYAGLDGVQIVRQNSVLEDIVSGVAAVTDGSSTSVIAAQGASIRTYVTDVIIANSSATAVTVDLRDGAAGSVKATFPVPANTSGVVFSFRTPLKFTANTAVCADPSAAASTVTTTLVGFKSKGG